MAKLGEVLSNFGILFDLDGTLIDSLSDIAGIVNHVRAGYGLAPLSLELIKENVGWGLEHLVEKTFTELSPEQVPELLRRYRQYYLEHPRSTGELYPGVRETLGTLRHHAGIKLGVVTNKSSPVADKTLAYYLPEIRFDIVAGPERVSERKPSPRHLLDVLAQLGLEPSEAWYIGDHEVDAECARAAGVRFLGAGYGFGGVRVEESRMLGSFPELLKKIPLPD